MKAWFGFALVAVSMVTYAAASPFDRSVSLLNTLMQGASAWFERVRRVPTLSWKSPPRSSLARGGGRVTVGQAHVTVCDHQRLPSDSPVTAVVEGEAGLFVGTFDDGVYRLGGPRADPWRLSGVDARVNDLALGCLLYTSPSPRD